METPATSNKSIERSSSYPSVGLKKAIELTEKARKALGKGYYSREAYAKALGYSGISGASARAVAALVHYGLIIRKGDSYCQSELAERIITPLGQDERDVAILEALKSPKLFGQLIGEFEGEELPYQLDAVLARKHNINEKVSKDVAVTFRESAEFAGVLANGRMSTPGQESNDSANELTDNYPTKSIDSSQSDRQDGNTVDLPSGVRVVFPSEFGYMLALGKFAEPLQDLEEIINIAGVKSGRENGNEQEKPSI